MRIVVDGKSIGNRIKYARTRAGITQDELAVRVGTNSRQVWRWESGENIPKADVLRLLSDVLDVPTDYLVGKDRTPIFGLTPQEFAIFTALREGDKIGAIWLIVAKYPPHNAPIDANTIDDMMDFFENYQKKDNE